MSKQIFLAFAFAALSVASAATYNVTFVEPCVVKGRLLKAGDYQLNMKENTAVILKGNKEQVEVPVKIEDTHVLYHRTRVLFQENKGKYSIHEIDLGGTTTKLTVDNGVQTGGGE
jgi:hypothetical protein